MEPFIRLTAIAAPLLRANIDTDQIIPTRFLVGLSAQSLQDGLFAEWRTRADGTPDPDFLLNRAPWNRAAILVAGPNFGCGSSREAAPRALRHHGFRAVIAASFGDIFFDNCFRCGILPVRLPQETVQAIGAALQAREPFGGGELTVDLQENIVRVPGSSDAAHAFETPPLLRRMLLEGMDEIALTLSRTEAIKRFRAADRARQPWAYL